LTGAGNQPGPVASDLLADLVTNTLDAGYAAAARRKAAAPVPASLRRRWFEGADVAIACVLIGFVLAVGYIHENRGAPEGAKVHAALVSRVVAAQDARNALEAQERSLSSNVDQLRNDELGASGAVSAGIAREELLAGTIAVKGRGVRVRLADAVAPTATQGNTRKGTIPLGAVQLITDRDVRSVVNQLWSDGAEAISVNDVRLTPTAAIRFAGEAVLVDFEPIASPYTIRAIGNPDSLDTGFASSAIASRYQTLAAADGIDFSFDEEDSLTLPASAATTPRYAQPLTDAPTAGATR
jgi:uncharacterized protein YlxW (UPF0749 family)